MPDAREILLVTLVLAYSSGIASAASDFAPKVKDVCTASATAGKGLILNPRKFVALLVEKKAGLSAIDLDAEGNGLTYKQQAYALLSPEEFCKTSTCAKGAVDKLGDANVKLIEFVSTHSLPTKAGVNSFDTSRVAVTTSGLGGFLEGKTEVECYSAPTTKEPAAPGPDGTPGSAPELPQHLSIRQTVEDLHYSQDDNKFKSLKQASLSLSDDRIAGKSSFSINGAVGYTVGRASFDEDGHFIGQFTPFLTYEQQYVETKTKTTRVQNLGAGFVGDLTFPIGGLYQNISAFPKIVRSFSSEAEFLSGNIVYTPMYGISGVDNVYYLAPGSLSFQISPSIKAAYSRILHAGTDDTLREQGSYFWIGPQISLTLFGEGVLDGFNYNISYSTFLVPNGKIKEISYFETSLSYDFGASKLMSIQAKYEKGRNLDTLEKVDQFTVGLGVKY
ncbi:hypothetical protein LB554_29370 [Mesorhizobium sp. CO1-1-11]|uniref:hypothetical protein n=1 Tax=Mesorhizobium sp. CO1-1-11 TaxID=2876636 RepID=UPI001CCCDB1A|nr:hypothetical protein [Mesorhizobium sp. CO1-1-11]MBZ9728054.1 hypothetical protein [Mesorhizobium sp. CO1-1-11]